MKADGSEDNDFMEAPVESATVTDSQAFTVRGLLDDQSLGIDLTLAAGTGGVERLIRNARIQKSGLALVGHFEGFEAWRVQLFGATENSFLRNLAPDVRYSSCKQFCDHRPCAIVVTRGGPPHPELVRAADETDTPVLVSPRRSSTTINALHTLLDDRLAPKTSVYGVLVSIFGLGVLLIGRSGIGKSECALDLVMRGHRLVADDIVECTFRPMTMTTNITPSSTATRGTIVGTPADDIKNHIEIRGLGVLNVRDLFGVIAVCERSTIDLVVRLSDEVAQDWDRLGLDDRFHRILGVDIPVVTIPVRPGRDVSAIVQIAARNELLKRTGVHSARALVDRIDEILVRGGR